MKNKNNNNLLLGNKDSTTCISCRVTMTVNHISTECSWAQKLCALVLNMCNSKYEMCSSKLKSM